MVDKPVFVWQGSPNFWQGRQGLAVVAIVNHRTQGGKESVRARFQNANDPDPVSAHFLICKDGAIWQFVKTSDSAWGNGIFQKPNTAIGWIADCVAKGINPNRVTISIEHELLDGEALNEVQYQATLSVQRWLVATFAIPVDRDHIVRHADIESIDRAGCPGTNYPWDRLMKDLAATVQAQGTQPAAPAIQYFKETGHSIGGGFLGFWRANGDVRFFGFPLKEEEQEECEDGITRTVQYFERARFEYHRDAQAGEQVMLGRVGAELLAARQKGG